MRWFQAFVVLCCIQASCGEKQPQQAMNYSEAQERLIAANRQRVADERSTIAAYIANKGWEMDSTGTGLRYRIYENGDGDQAKPGMLATLDYTISLLNDSVVYSSERNGLLSFVIGRDFVETGLHEAMGHFRQGDRANVILPSHLAHGLTGDFGRIPGNSPVMYDLHVQALQ